MEHTISARRQTQVVDQLMGQVRTLLTELVAQVGQTPLGDLETQASHVGQQIAQQVLSATVAAVAPTYPAPRVACRCGAEAVYQRRRPATVITQVGAITYRRAYYLCATCHQGQSPLDQALGWCAGSLSASMQQRLAVLGASLPFARAAQLLADLTQVQLSAPTVRRATQQVGAQLPALPPSVLPPADPLYLSADGVMVQIRQEGWKEVRVACASTTQVRQTRHGLQPQTDQPQYRADLWDIPQVGQALEALRAPRAPVSAGRCIVLGDGAHWLDTLATDWWPHATRIVDWFHALHYLQEAATVLLAAQVVPASWAAEQETALWEGHVQDVIDRLHDWAWKWPAVAQAETYYLHHRHAMAYATYRAQGWQIGSGTIESACKQVVQARCKGAGMRWSRLGIRHVLAVRSRWLGHEWSACASALAPPARAYQRMPASAAA